MASHSHSRSGSAVDRTALTQTFQYETPTHSFTVKWCSIGDKTSPPLIFIHGTPWSSRVWVPYALSLSRRFRVYLFDRPGFGESPPEKDKDRDNKPGKHHSSKVSEFDADLARQSEVFAALFESWQETAAAADPDAHRTAPHVVAHDNAGLISLRAYLLHGCQYASLCLMNVVALGPFGQSLFKVVGEDPGRFKQLPDMAVQGMLEGYIRNAAFSELSSETMRILREPWTREGGKEGFIRELCQANVRSAEEVEGRYGEVGARIPVKVVWGAEDNWIPVETAWRLDKALNARDVVEIEEAGHLVMIDQPGRVGIELGTWLSSV
ncbi:hypothetical protein QQS21_006081 [Conoideocrella luteorostrata]|uniref:AB hydrolase-1 domain-containing protein n=1 Tax=Conoideocrella luteorostrata TaxID=1105319 RepID=A0AAJ0CSG9_9HYPO|nr:hypothetical protein QQS21_006081 [Conoideocrella luteorostrata]